MGKEYLKTIEDIEALRNTDTKIYVENWDVSYFRFVNSVLCEYRLEDDKLLRYNVTLRCDDRQYIEVEDEPSEDLIGRLGRFWDKDERDSRISFLEDIVYDAYKDAHGCFYEHFRLLTPEEIEKYSGYKVVKEK